MADGELIQGKEFFNMIAEGEEVTPEKKAQIEAFLREGSEEEKKGLPLQMPRVDILHQGARAFKFIETDDIVKEFDAVVIHVEPQRAWWATAMGSGEANKYPDCFSRDLLAPDPESTSKQAEKCLGCPHNEFGSERKADGQPGRGKACKEVRQLFFLPSGKLAPHRMNVPPSSLKKLSSYITHLQEKKIPRIQAAVTKFKLLTAANKDGTDYSELDLSFVGPIPFAGLSLILDAKTQVASMVRRAAPMTVGEFKGEGTPPPAAH